MLPPISTTLIAQCWNPNQVGRHFCGSRCCGSSSRERRVGHLVPVRNSAKLVPTFESGTHFLLEVGIRGNIFVRHAHVVMSQEIPHAGWINPTPQNCCGKGVTEPVELPGPTQFSTSLPALRTLLAVQASSECVDTRLVSVVIQRRPQSSATNAVVPLPHVGSSTKSPGSVVIKRQRSITFALVWTTYLFASI